MSDDRMEQLRALPRLGDLAARVPHTLCKICGAEAPFFDVVDFQKCCSIEAPYAFGISGIQVLYYRCNSCRFIQTTFVDGWSAEDFARFIYNDDYVKVDPDYASIRPAQQASRMGGLLAPFKSHRILDYGSGTGLLRERLLQSGFDRVENFDPFSSPNRPSGTFDIITCFEVLEHSVSPRQTIRDMVSLLAPGGCMIFTTAIQPANINELRANWWYIGPRNGHISIFSAEALGILAAQCGLNLYLGPGESAFGTSEPSTEIAVLLRTLGRPYVVLPLSSPNRAGAPNGPAEAMGDPAQWHGIEAGHTGHFRWSKASQLTWRIGTTIRSPCTIEITCPFTMEIRAGFASECRMKFGNVSMPVSVEGGAIVARGEIDDASDPVVTLLTPPTLRPSELRASSDSRPLGLAVPVAPTIEVTP